MNTGAVTRRYATVLLELTRESGRGRQVFSQVRSLLRNPRSIPSPLEDDLQRFVVFVAEKGRSDYLRRIFRTYLDLYCEAEGLQHVILTSAEPSPELEKRIRLALQERFGAKVILETDTDPSLIGGFLIEVNGYLLDASVSRQLELVRRELTVKHNRIV